MGLETRRLCQPFPGPGVPMPRWSTAGFLQPHAAGRNRARLSGKCIRLGYADGSSSNREDVTPTPLREPPADPGLGDGAESHSHFTDEALDAQRGNCFAQVIQLLSGRARLQVQASRLQVLAPANRKASLLSRAHTVLPLLPALPSMMF